MYNVNGDIMNEIGNRQNRIRVYNNNKRRNKKKSLFIYKFAFLVVPIIGFIQYLFSSNKQFEKTKFEKIDKLSIDIGNIKNDINNIKTKEDLNEIEINIKEKEDILNKIKKTKENIKIKNKVGKDLITLNNYKIDLEELKESKNLKEVSKEDLELVVSNIEKEKLEKLKKEISVINNSKKVNENEIKKEPNNVKKQSSQSKEIKVTKIEEHPFKIKMIKINEKIDEIKDNFVALELRMRRNSPYEEMDKDLKELKEKIDKLKKELDLIKDKENLKQLKNDFEILKIDTNKFLEEKIFEEFEMLYKHQYDLIEKKKPKEEKKEVIKEEKKETKIIKNNEKYNEDLFIMNEYIKKDIDKVNKEIMKLNKIVNKNERNQRSIPVFRNFLSATLKFGVSLLPMGLFKNKFIGSLLSMVLLNNKIRSMRNIVKKQKIQYLDANTLLENVRKNTDIVNKTTTICDDSLYQLFSLKEEILSEYSLYLNTEEITQTLLKIEVLENTLIKQKEKLTGIKYNLDKVKIKVMEIK